VKKSRSGNYISFSTFDLAHDVASLVSSVNEVVSISGSLFASGTTGNANVKFYSNISSGSLTATIGGYFQTIYDSPPTSVSSTALFDLTFGYNPSSSFNRPFAAVSSQNEKIKVYRELANALLGSPDAIFTVNNVNVTEAFFIMIKRGLMKDELKKGASLLSMTGTVAGIAGVSLTASDAAAAFAFKQTLGGDYAPLLSGTTEVAQVWYNAGVIVVPASGAAGVGPWNSAADQWSGSFKLNDCMASATIDNCVDGLRAKVTNIYFNNQTNLYSTIYFCRAKNTDFNYSSNPTFVDSNKRIIVTSGSNVLQTRTYITTIGLYDANDNLLATGKLNKPITKSPDTEAIFRIRLDY
jgi:hypothetical protein